jgi:uncharacterized membrane protein
MYRSDKTMCRIVDDRQRVRRNGADERESHSRAERGRQWRAIQRQQCGRGIATMAIDLDYYCWNIGFVIVLVVVVVVCFEKKKTMIVVCLLAVGIGMFVMARREAKAADELRAWAQKTGAAPAAAAPVKTYDGVRLLSRLIVIYIDVV